MVRLLFLGSLFFANLLSTTQAADIIVNNSVPAYHYSLNDVRAIFTMRLTQWSNGEAIRVFVLPDDHPLHKSFAKTSLNLFSYQLRNIWNRAVYSGTGSAPTQVSSPEEMLQAISNTPNSIGYLDSKPETSKVRTLDSP
jgi:ABC-type phosphate transport system substrate-binding protein